MSSENENMKKMDRDELLALYKKNKEKLKDLYKENNNLNEKIKKLNE